ncbi:glutaredoxin [Acaromyces ingoldii]|uniref:glutathione peroxidase n=1 Tax=Acaromyces ingoldii TaxID=215250 RepID=A0A316YXR3_9BASI|nr:glutaredoxin [Acaromyces ingoldii]PWN93981.1 glutaredoxin [Acaromyces ingoldii]
MSVKQKTEDLIKSTKVVVFSKSWCPYCRQAKTTLGGHSDLPESDVTVVELDQVEDGDAIQAYLADKTGQRTVPNIFVSGTHLGGNDDLQKANSSGALKKQLTAAA